MQLKYGSKFFISDEILREISSYKHRICSVEEILKLSRNHQIIAVGDATSRTLEKNNVPMKLSIVDLKTKREGKREYRHRKSSIVVRNEASTLSHDLFIEISKILQSDKQGRIEVLGEEDLAVIPIIYYSDINTVVSYGVPDVGIACITVDDQMKVYITSLIERMSVVDD